ncbi:serine--tRNA ligase [Candidatus Nomurabacteria bacterium]|uniref:Serine--tRNA ligase n=1 Tax=candidate division WWE3 bacterium TaxID=2053526 RepID=A0A955DZC9_UNCKA|nr:serine--tRNA ligase [candidate division WWE3 bacterium]MCB9823798.1 serine--tRNA ligase [Candidatus Nomurabacteria bacterium]MCB9826796.1 serine--tRNA ligase [Candidatus Nomurabacteria bacterium]MCB9827593.1 serine--tRNA ligase [Candidatus Nomurabacteria bacterium]
MLDIKIIRENPEVVKKAIEDKNMNGVVDIDRLLQVDVEYRNLLKKVEELRAIRNELSQDISKVSGDAREKLITQASDTKEELKGLEDKLLVLKNELDAMVMAVPNIPSADVPVGRDESGNEILKHVGDIPKLDFEPKDHVELGESLGIISFEDGAKVSGSQFYFLYGAGVLMELALVQYAFEKLSKAGFTPTLTPDLAKSRYYLGTGYAPRGDEAQTYTIEGEDLGLIATAEVTLAGKHADEVLLLENLPLKYVGYSHCFRKEAGAYGKYSKGLYRVHQFTKVEMFIYCKPEESMQMHDYLLEMEESIYQGLGISYRVLKQCTGDLGAMAARKYDIEAWMPGRKDYGEVTSTSNCTDYQARNLNIKYKLDTGGTEYVHMLNGTAVATSRTIIAILENYQQADGSVLIPEVLKPYMNGLEVIRPISLRDKPRPQ